MEQIPRSPISHLRIFPPFSRVGNSQPALETPGFHTHDVCLVRSAKRKLSSTRHAIIDMLATVKSWSLRHWNLLGGGSPSTWREQKGPWRLMSLKVSVLFEVQWPNASDGIKRSQSAKKNVCIICISVSLFRSINSKTSILKRLHCSPQNLHDPRQGLWSIPLPAISKGSKSLDSWTCAEQSSVVETSSKL